MGKTNLHIIDTITEAIGIITSRQRLKEFLATPLYSNAAYLMSHSIVVIPFNFFFWVVVARFYTDTEVGESAAIISATTLLATLSLLGFNYSIIRFLPQVKKPQELINACLTMCGLASLLIVGVFIVGIDFWSPALIFIKENIVFSAIFIIVTLTLALSNLVCTAFVAQRKASFALWHGLISSAIKIPLPILFALFLHSAGIVASFGIALGIAIILSLFLFMPKSQSHYKPIPTLKLGLIKDMWQYSGGSYLISFFMAAPFLVLSIMVLNLLGPEQSAYFYMAWMVAALLFNIPTGIAMSLFAEGSSFEDKLHENVTKSLKFTFLLLVPLIIIFALAGKWILLVFGQSYSANALYLLWILVVSSLPYAINSIYTSILRVTNRIKELVAIWGFIAMVTIAGSYLIVPTAGIIGIGYVWLGTQCVVAIYAVVFDKWGKRRRMIEKQGENRINDSS